MSGKTEKTKFIDYLYCNKDLIVSLLELLNMRVEDSYGVKKIIDILKDMFIKYQNGQGDANITHKVSIPDIFTT